MGTGVAKKRFWIPRAFVDSHARNFSPYMQVVYMALCRYADADGFSFWGCRRLGEVLGINKSTVSKAIRGLIKYGLVTRGKGKRKSVYGLYVNGACFKTPAVSNETGPKELSKKLYKYEIVPKPIEPGSLRDIVIQAVRKTDPAVADRLVAIYEGRT